MRKRIKYEKGDGGRMYSVAPEGCRRIVMLPGGMTGDTTYFQEVVLSVSNELANQLVAQGDAREEEKP